jgi:heme/copper-type cytochrome/quinol oxidase subunit 2
MEQKKFKTKDMIIAVFCTILAILCIVFYFLPAFNIKDSASPMMEYEEHLYSGWDMTRACFARTKVYGTSWGELTFVKEVFGFAIILGGILMPLSILCVITTTVFAYLSWLKSEELKKFCFLFSLCAMIFQTITLICTWFIALMSKNGTYQEMFKSNVKGGMSYGAFVSLILVFVVAIIACAYNYFLENFDDEEEEEEDEDEEDEEGEPAPKKKKKVIVIEDDEEIEIVKKPKTTEAKVETKPATKAPAKTAAKTTTKTAPKTAAKKA